MTHIALYGLLGVILALELSVSARFDSGGVHFIPQNWSPCAIRCAICQAQSSSADGSLSSHDQSPPEGTAPLEGDRHLAATSFSTPVTIAYLNHLTFFYCKYSRLQHCYIVWCCTAVLAVCVPSIWYRTSNEWLQLEGFNGFATRPKDRS